MKPPTKIAIIGCGGIACQLVPVLSLDYNLVLIDGDKFEPKNSTRQFPALKTTTNKALALLSMQHDRTTKSIAAIPTYMEGPSIVNDPEWRGVDMIIGCVDNNESRKLICDLADQEFIPAILCGNEVEMGEAHLHWPAGQYDPFDHHDFGPMTKAPFSCTSDENAESAPQTSGANYLAAAGAVHILMSWCKAENEKWVIVHSRLDVRADSHRSRLADYQTVTGLPSTPTQANPRLAQSAG